MKAIQDRYAKYKITDPERQKMNTEVMELYKSQGRQSGERLRADAPDAAVPVRVLRDARPGHRDPRRELLVDSRPVALQDPFFIMPALMGIRCSGSRGSRRRRPIRRSRRS